MALSKPRPRHIQRGRSGPSDLGAQTRKPRQRRTGHYSRGIQPGTSENAAVRNLPHPGVVLSTHRWSFIEPDSDEVGFAPDVKTAFYRALASDFNDAQVVVFENENPPQDLDRSANIIRFTGTSLGRPGFIPARDKEVAELTLRWPVRVRRPGPVSVQRLGLSHQTQHEGARSLPPPSPFSGVALS